ncbi:unnamed protein product [Auanema sp. JU1783]|nr:unnamed protein product [Auanema sp. JU1783]
MEETNKTLENEPPSEEVAAPRHSLSQPDLRKRPRKEHIEKIPILATFEENKRLNRENFILNSKLKDATYRERELRDQLPREVDAIMEEFFALQLGRQEFERKYSELSATVVRAEKAEENERIALERAEKAEQMLSDLEKDTDSENGRLKEDLEKLRIRIAELEEVNCGNDDWTLASSAGDRAMEEISDELERCKRDCNELTTKNKELESVITQLKEDLDKTTNKTFMLGVPEDTNILIERIKSLEEESRVKEENYSAVIKSYMKKVTKLERALVRAEGSFDITPNLTFTATDKTKLDKCVKSLMNELTSARSQNQELRRQCAALSGGVLDISSVVDNDNIRQKLVDLSHNISPRDENEGEDYNENIRKVVEECDEIFQKLEQQGLLDLSYDLSAESSGNKSNSMPVLEAIERDAEDEDNDEEKEQNKFEDPNMSELLAMNQSINNILYHSLNTSTEIGETRVKLASVRTLISSMFNRLKGSAALFEEIFEYLSEGSEANKELAEKISQMSLEWTKARREAEDVSNVIDYAETSVAQLQNQLSALENSLNESSFIFEASRRITLNRTGGVDMNMSRNLHMSVLENQNLASAHNELNNLRTKYDDACETVDKLNELIEELKDDKANLASSLSMANSSVDVIRKHLNEVEIANSNLQLEKDEFSARCSDYQQNTKHLTEMLQNMQTECDSLRERLGGLEKHNNLLNEDIAAYKRVEDQMKMDLSLANHEKETLISSVEEWKEEAETFKQSFEARSASLNKLKEDYKALKIEVEQASTELAEAKVALHSFERDTEKQRRYFEEEIRAQTEIAQAARDNANELAEKLMDKEHSLIGDRQSKFGLVVGNDERLSLIDRSNQKTRCIQTDDDGLAEMLTEYFSMYTRLATCVRKYLSFSQHDYDYQTENSVEFMEFDLNNIEQEIKTFCKQYEDNVEHMVRVNNKLIEYGEVNDSCSQPATSDVPHYQKTEIEQGRRVSPLKQLLYALTMQSVDLVQNVKLLHKHMDNPKRGDIVVKLLNDARSLRNQLNDNYACFQSKDKENDLSLVPQGEVIQKLEHAEKVNAVLFAGLKQANDKLIELEKAVPKSNKAVIEKISKEMENIAKVMGSAQISSKNLSLARKPVMKPIAKNTL